MILKVQPRVKFCAKNREHRLLFADFMKSGSWSGIPYRFAVDDTGPDLITLIQRELISFYLAKEFNV